MSSYCVRCKSITPEVNTTAVQTNNNRIAKKSVCPVCGANKSIFIFMNASKFPKEGRFLGLIKVCLVWALAALALV